MDKVSLQKLAVILPLLFSLCGCVVLLSGVAGGVGAAVWFFLVMMTATTSAASMRTIAIFPVLFITGSWEKWFQASIFWISCGEGTLPTTLTTPSTARAGVIITPNFMMSLRSVTFSRV